jgi:WD40 repeat protein
LKKDSYKNSLKNYILQPKNEFKVLNDHKSYIYTVAFSPDGNTFATGSCDKTIKIYDCNVICLLITKVIPFNCFTIGSYRVCLFVVLL